MHVLVVGASVVDLFMTVDPEFVKISDGAVSLNLGDKIPSSIKSLALGGNGANISVGLTRLGIPTSFYTYFGSDALSREIEQGLSSEGIKLVGGRGLIKNAPLHIILDFNQDRIILSHYEKADYDFKLSDSDNYNYLYLNSISDNWEKAYEQVFEYANSRHIPFVFSPGTRQLDNLNDTVFKIIKNSKIFFSNREEAAKIVKEDPGDIKTILIKMKELGPEVVSVTDGPEGAYAVDSQNNVLFIKPLPCESSEKTGAGDAYSTGFLAGFLYGCDIPTCMQWGNAEANAVMNEVGAQKGLLSRKMLDEKLASGDNLEAETIS